MPVTIRDVAQRAGVSAITVSRVLNGTTYVHTDTRARVEQAVRELQYVPNDLATSLRWRKTSTLALLLTDVTNTFWTTLARGVEDKAAEHGFVVFLCNTDEDPIKEEKYIDMLLRRRVDGLIIGPTVQSAPLMRRLQEQNSSFVLVDRAIEDITADLIRSDSRAGARSLTEHLLATGYRRIAFIGGPLDTSTGRDRAAGYEAALLAAGLIPDPELVKIGAYQQEDGFRLTTELMTAANRPDAIISGNNLLALGAMRSLLKLGIHVPQDVALVTFDEMPGLDSFPVFLTCAVQPAYEIGSMAVKLLLSRIASKEAGEQPQAEEFELPTRLVIGNSCGCAPL